MSAVVSSHLVTTEELLAMPRDGVERMLIRGELREKPMTKRGRRHTRTSTRVAQVLANWLDAQPEPRGEVLTGDAAFRVQRNPDSTVGIDLAYISADLARVTPANAKIIDGLPILAVEILSPSNTWEEISDKVECYLQAEILLVWVIDPALRTVTVYQPTGEHGFFNEHQELTAEPHLPGFRISVARLFAG